MVVTTCSHLIMPSLSERQLRRKPLVVILGPTAVGKSRIAVEVAKYLGSEILTADSRQVYRGMDVGTDKPTLLAREGMLSIPTNPSMPVSSGAMLLPQSTSVIDGGCFPC
jgi:hypothetical protein